jgi:hypothetical protein
MKGFNLTNKYAFQWIGVKEILNQNTLFYLQV